MLQDLLKAKGVRQSIVADACDVSEGTVSKWASGKIRVPAERVAKIAEVTGLAPHDLRPDLFPAPQVAA